MPLVDAALAQRFATHWIDAWNRHDLDAVLAHYAEAFEFTSPLITELAGEPSGRLQGKPAVRAYWEEGLRRIPELHFELLDVLAGVDQISLYYRGHRGTVVESFHFDRNGQVIQAAATYALAPAPRALLAPPALDPATVAARNTSNYPTEPWRKLVAGRSKQALGDALELRNFGINRVALAPGSRSALRHWHTRQDEFIYVLEGEITLITERGRQRLVAGLCAGFPAGKADGHHLINQGTETAVYLEIGDRSPGDQTYYPDEDLVASAVRAAYVFTHKDGSTY